MTVSRSSWHGKSGRFRTQVSSQGMILENSGSFEIRLPTTMISLSHCLLGNNRWSNSCVFSCLSTNAEVFCWFSDSLGAPVSAGEALRALLEVNAVHDVHALSQVMRVLLLS